jgi:hypothetical protein
MGYDSDTETITVGPGSDFMADSGVHFVHVHRDIALKKDAPEGIRRDWATLQDWLGCAGRPLNETDDENIRLAWMGYYAVGLAPSFNLQPAFDMFATQHDVTAYKKHKPPTAIMDVFDRMQASDADIAKKRAHDIAAAKSDFKAKLAPLQKQSSPGPSAEAKIPSFLRETEKLARVLFAVFVIAWGVWFNSMTNGFNYVQPVGWLIIIAVPLAVFFALPPSINYLKRSSSDVRKVFSANVMWVFVVAAWGYVFDWHDHFYNPERYAALFILPIAGSWIGLGLWKWSKSK